MGKYIYPLAVLLLTAFCVSAQNIITITDADLEGATTYNWTNDNVYLLDGLVILEADGTLNIEAGTVIKGMERPSTDTIASTLVIARGAQIFANGTDTEPIIFTAERDSVDMGIANLMPSDRGLWGGLIVLGDAPISALFPEKSIEGLPEGDARTTYGGTNGADNSGELSFISIRHGGAELSIDNEINGLTLGGVGSGTTIDHVDVFANLDDGIEFFGGTVDLKFASVGFCGDDAIDYDFGWSGKGQYWFVIQGADIADNGGEHSGTEAGANPPFTFPFIYNATYIGSGVDSDAKNEHALFFKDAAKGIFANSVITDFANHAIQVEDLQPTVNFLDTRFNMETRQLNLFNNVWFGFGSGSELNAGDNGIIKATEGGEDPTAQFLVDHLAGNGNEIIDPQLTNISRMPDGSLDPRPLEGSVLFGGELADYPNDPFFDEVDFKGAFGGELWLRGWTSLDFYGFLPAQTEITITDADLVADSTYTWTADFVYNLDGIVYLEAGGKLFIEPGTIVKGLENPTSDSTSALVIARGAQICAIGTAEAPIIFTAEIDDETLADDLPIDTTALWGGLIVLGDAMVTDTTSSLFYADLSTMDERAQFGGDNNGGNSGTLQYVSIRHAGAALNTGINANGLTLAGVGDSTRIEFVEVIAGADDGVVILGGAVNLKYLSTSFCGADAYEIDLGWSGFGQFWLGLQGMNAGASALNAEGANPSDNMPSTNPNIFNATFIGSGAGMADDNIGLQFTDGARGQYNNSIFTDFSGYAIQVEDLAAGAVDSRQYMENGEFTIANNLWFGYGQGGELNAGENGFIFADLTAEDVTAQFLIDHLATNGNAVVDPELNSIARMANGIFDPRPSFDGPAYATDLSAYPAADFFTRVAFKGAFCSDGIWAKGWTALDEYGVFDQDIPTVSVACDELPKDAVVIQDKDLVADSTYTWTSDQLYLLDGLVYLEAGGKLFIEAGTVVRGKQSPTNGDNTSALIIARGAQICASGTEEAPIILTTEIDDPVNPADMAVDDRGFWGGLAILGDAPITDMETEMSLINLPADDRAIYGGMDTMDNSGFLQYVSIRHAGAGFIADQVSSGLTLAAVGDSTIIEFVEVFAGLSNGIEFIGGEVNAKNVSVSFCAGDAFSINSGYVGKGQYWFALQDDNAAQNAFTSKGADPVENMPSSNPIVFNATLIGSGLDAAADNLFALELDDASRGLLANSVFTDFTNFAITVEDVAGNQIDSRQYMENGELKFLNNVWFNFGEGNELNAGDNGFIFAAADAEDPTAQFLIDSLAATGNAILDPGLGSISRSANGNLDPRPTTGDLFLDLAANLPDPFFQRTLYKGAFCTQGVWIKGWTALDEYRVLNANIETAPLDCEIVSTEELVAEQDGFLLHQNAPNPVNGVTNIQFTLPMASTINLVVYDLNGRVVKTLAQNQRLQAGEHQIEVNTTDLPSGTYVYALYNQAVTLAKLMVVE